jgi:hypothetical protein
MGVASLQIRTRLLSTIVFSIQIASQRFSPGIPFEISHYSILQIARCFSKRISVSLELNCIQNLNVMAPESPMQRSLLSVERRMNLRLVEPMSSYSLEKLLPSSRISNTVCTHLNFVLQRFALPVSKHHLSLSFVACSNCERASTITDVDQDITKRR